MFRCTNPECRSAKSFKVTRAGYKYELVDGKAVETIGATQRGNIIKEYWHWKMTCNTCGHKDRVENMHDCFKDPMKHFDTGNLCSCGGEIWQDIEVVKPQINTENSGGFDGQRQVSMSTRVTVRCERCKQLFGPK